MDNNKAKALIKLIKRDYRQAKIEFEEDILNPNVTTMKVMIKKDGRVFIIDREYIMRKIDPFIAGEEVCKAIKDKLKEEA